MNGHRTAHGHCYCRHSGFSVVAGTSEADVGQAKAVPLATNELVAQSTSMLIEGGEHYPAASWLQFAPLVVPVYLAGVVLMLARLSLSIVRSNRLCRRTRPIENGPLAEILQSLSHQWSLKVVPTLVEARNAVVPQVVGLLRPTILLPAAAISGLSTKDLELVLVHELAHIRRHDMWVHLLQRIALVEVEQHQLEGAEI